MYEVETAFSQYRSVCHFVQMQNFRFKAVALQWTKSSVEEVIPVKEAFLGFGTSRKWSLHISKGTLHMAF